MRWLWWCATVVTVLDFGSIAWAVRGHFRAEGGMERGMTAISGLTTAGFLWWLWERIVTGQPSRAYPHWADLAGSVFVVGALALFWWTVQTTRVRRLTLAYSPDVPTFLHVTGSYAWVRHPFYTSYMLMWIGAALETSSWAFWLMPMCMMLVYVHAAREEEAKFEQSPLDRSYREYRSFTGMLIPSLSRPRRRQF